MGARKHLHLLLIVAFMPLLLANKDCARSTTWGDKFASKWEDDHASIDKDTQCIDCHDNFSSASSKPGSHTGPAWLRSHGSFAQLKYGMQHENVCYRCHTEATCSSCHQAETPENHTEFWKQRGHGAMAGLNRSSCMSCHKDVQFCESCHAETRPPSHNASWGNTSNNHCYSSCHYPISSVGAQECRTCHSSTPSHDSAPNRPSNGLHADTADCASCHRPMRHPDNGMSCIACHSR